MIYIKQISGEQLAVLILAWLAINHNKVMSFKGRKFNLRLMKAA